MFFSEYKAQRNFPLVFHWFQTEPSFQDGWSEMGSLLLFWTETYLPWRFEPRQGDLSRGKLCGLQVILLHHYLKPSYSRGERQFEQEYHGVLGDQFSAVLKEVQQEVERRSSRFKVMMENKLNISKLYSPKHSDLFDDSKLDVLDLGEMKKLSKDIFTFPLFSDKLCDVIVEELENFKKTKLAHSRPNSMNKYGIILEEVGLEKIVEVVKEKVEHVAKVKYPDVVGESGLDSAKAFTVDYDAEEESADKELATHFDNAEVNISNWNFQYLNETVLSF